MPFDPAKLAAIKTGQPQSGRFDPNKLEALKKRPSIPSQMVSRAQEVFRATSDIPTTALLTGVRGALEATKRAKALLPPASQVAETLGAKIPAPLAATAGAVAGLAKTFIPETEAELGMQIAGVKIVPQAVRGYLGRVAPSLTEFLFPDVGKFGAQALGKFPEKVEKIASLGKEGVGRAETAAVNKIRAGVGKVLKDARQKFGQAKTSILLKSQNPEVEAQPLAASVGKTLVKFNFIPELETTAASNPKLASVARAAVNDIEEFATRPTGVRVSELMRFRENLNSMLFGGRLTDKTRAAILDIKTSVDGLIQKGLGDEAFSAYGAANKAFGSVASKFGEINSLVSKTGAAKRITREVEEQSELGQKLIDFVKDASSLDELVAATGARRFAGDVFSNLAAGSSAPFLARLYRFGTLAPGAGIAGRAGLPTTPLGVARFAAATSRLAPRLAGAATAASSPLFRKENRSSLFGGPQ